MPETSSICPKCGQPRQPQALDCPYCGIIYDRYRPAAGSIGTAEGAVPLPPSSRYPPAEPYPPTEPYPPAEPYPPPAPALDSVYQGPAPGGGLDDVYQGPAPGAAPPGTWSGTGPPAHRPMAPGAGGHAPPSRFAPPPPAGPVQTENNVFTENLALSILVALVALLVLNAWVQSRVVGYQEGREKVALSFLRTSGLNAPADLPEGHLFTFVGRRFFLFGNPFAPTPSGEISPFLLFYHHGPLAGSMELDELASRVGSTLDFMQLPWNLVSERPIEILGQPERTQVIRLGDPQHSSGQLVAITYLARDGQPALLVVGGSRSTVGRMLRELY